VRININKLILSVVLILGLSGCGAGGREPGLGPKPPADSSGGGSDSTLSSLTYTGKTAPARLDSSNANVLMADIMGEPDVSSNVALRTVHTDTQGTASNSSLIRTMRKLADSGRSKSLSPWPVRQTNHSAVAAASTTTNADTQDCKISGTVTVSKTLDSDNTGTASMQYSNCDDGGITLDGDVTFQVDAFDDQSQVIVDSTLKSDRLTLSDSSSSSVFGGSIHVQLSLAASRETLTINGVFLDKRTSKYLKLDNIVIKSNYEDILDSESAFSQTVSGRLYDSVEGYVDISTKTAFFYASQSSASPSSGLLLIAGALGSQAQMRALVSGKARLEVDANGDNEFETDANYLWGSLSGEPAANESPTGTVSLAPVVPKADDELDAIVTASDPDGDPITYSYTWTRNGVKISGAEDPSLKGVFVKGDVIAVEVGVADGVSTTTLRDSVEIADSAPVFVTPGSLDVAYGTTMTYQAQASDIDGESISYDLAYAPAGMEIDAATGEVTWKPSEPMFDESLTVHFGVRATAADNSTVVDTTADISDPDHKIPLVRTGLKIPSRPDSLRVADFDGDGSNEILMSDNNKVLSTWVYDEVDDKYVQNWVDPFDLSPGDAIGAITAHDINGDGHPDMIVAVGRRILILDGVTRKVLGSIEDGFHNHFSIQVADLDGDGKDEIVYLGTNDPYDSSSNITINIYSAAVSPEFVWQSKVADCGTSLAIGDVDDDAALEIVTSKGYVYDGVTYQNQWSYSAGFGDQVKVGDLDDDGVDEIVGMDVGSAIRIYNARNKSQSGSIVPSSTDMDVLLVANIDDDAQAEILIGNGRAGDVTAYDGVTHEEEWHIDSQNYGVSSIAIGDADDDGKDEVVWTSGAASSRANSLVVAGLQPSVNIEWTNKAVNGSSQETVFHLDGPFVGARWLKTSVGGYQAVFVSVSTDAGYGGTRLVGIDTDTGTTSISSEVGSNWDGRAAIDGADYDGDGIDEVFLATSSLYDGYLTAYDFSLDTSEWTSVSGLGAAQAVTHGDLTKDGKDDLIAVTIDGYIYTYDVLNSSLIWRSARLPGDAAYDVEAADLDDDGVLEIIAASPDTVSVYKQDSVDGYVLRGSIAVPGVSCIAIGDVDLDGVVDIVAASGLLLDPNAVRIYDGVSLDEKASYASPVGAWVTDVEVVPSSGGPGHLMLATTDLTYNGYFYSSLNNLVQIDALSGNEIWLSPFLVGVVQPNSVSFADVNDDGTQELLIGTSAAMYVTR
jgi:hypothetical protein